MSMIEIANLSLCFGTGAALNAVLHDVDLSVAEGEAFGLVGESGSGKTTVLRCLAGQYQHWTGQLQVAGQTVTRNLPLNHYRTVQMVFQDPYASLHPRYTIDAALQEPLRIHGIDGRAQKVSEILRKVGLNDSFRYRLGRVGRFRINRKLGLTKNADPVKIEFDLMPLVPRKEWTDYSHLIIHHGRVRCVARRPDCAHCAVNDLCPSREDR